MKESYLVGYLGGPPADDGQETHNAGEKGHTGHRNSTASRSRSLALKGSTTLVRAGQVYKVRLSEVNGNLTHSLRVNTGKRACGKGC